MEQILFESKIFNESAINKNESYIADNVKIENTETNTIDEWVINHISVDLTNYYGEIAKVHFSIYDNYLPWETADEDIKELFEGYHIMNIDNMIDMYKKLQK